MEVFFKWILNHKKFLVSLFLFSSIICAFFYMQVDVNYNLNDYLPQDSPSTKAIDIMEEEFEGGIPNARIMIKDVSISKALDYKKKLLDIDGVKDVSWLDDAVNIRKPMQSQDLETVESYYKDKNALFNVTIDDKHIVESIDSIRDLIGDKNSMTGAAVNTAVATESTVKEISKIVKIAVPLVFLILLVTTTSWFEPVILLITIGVAILLNSGSNLMFGTISFVTNGAGNILQLAVSLDYSVFLLHRFNEYCKSGLDAETAMFKALSKSVSSILSSGVTTMIGFAALILMRFKIGPDLGLSLAKGIAFSLLTVFTLLPVLVLLTYNLFEKTSHKPLLPEFKKFGRFVSKIMIPAVIILSILIVPSYLAQINNSFYYGSEHIFGPSTKLGSDTETINDMFGKSNTMVLMVPSKGSPTQIKLSDDLKNIKEVNNIISYVDTAGAEIPYEYLDKKMLNKLESDNYSRMILTVKTKFEGERAFEVVEEVRDVAQKYYPDKWYLAGESASTYDLMDTIKADNIRVNLIAITAVFIVLLLTFKSLIIPVILVLIIETAIWINLSVPYFSDTILFYLAYLIVSSIQLGSTVDYAILMTNRYLEFRRDFNKKDSVEKTISTVTVSILTSGLALVIAGFLLYFITSHGILKEIGLLLGRGTLMSMTIVFLALPGLMYLLDKPIEKTTKGVKFIKKENEK
ncbi:MAG: efflux RND transporter permease subunit [Senegalia sp. (in: firmicutes)]